jgi:vitamin-K-epoxide reductase (warfarin-sensitive)
MQPAMTPRTLDSLANDSRGMGQRRLMSAIALIAVAGAIVSSVSLYHHYHTSKTAFCNFGASFNCDLVNRSPYSIVLGVPVALIGILGYLLILSLATIYRDKAETPFMLLIASVGGLCFALYLTYIEKFVLAAWCVLCLGSLTLIFSAALLSAVLAARSLRKR